jgi:hypothetical protein
MAGISVENAVMAGCGAMLGAPRSNKSIRRQISDHSLVNYK